MKTEEQILFLHNDYHSFLEEKKIQVRLEIIFLVQKNTCDYVGIKVDIDNVASFLVTNDYDFATEETISTGLSKFISFQNRKIKNLLFFLKFLFVLK